MHPACDAEGREEYYESFARHITEEPNRLRDEFNEITLSYKRVIRVLLTVIETPHPLTHVCGYSVQDAIAIAKRHVASLEYAEEMQRKKDSCIRLEEIAKLKLEKQSLEDRLRKLEKAEVSE